MASQTKAVKILDYLRGKGITPARLARVKAPAGLPIGTVSPEEIAVSILAEIVQKGRAEQAAAPQPATAVWPTVKSEAKDPVCGMMVDMARAKHSVQFEGRTVYFCCPRCKQAFERSPQSYATESS